jgi:hypothetical protein
MIKQNKLFPEGISVGLLILSVLAIFSKVIFTGDSLFGMDFVLQFYSWKKFILESLWSQGSLPFWNPYLFSGIPFISNIQASMFYPLGFLYYLLPPESAYVYSTILHCSLGSVFMYVFMREIPISPKASFFSAIVFSFNGFFMGHLYAGHLSFVQNYIWIPIIYLFLHRFVRRRHFRDAVIAGLFLGIQILGGFPQIAFYSILGILCFGLFYGTHYIVDSSKKDGFYIFFGLIVIICTGFGFAAVQVLPTLEFTQLSTRAGGVDYAFATYESLHPKELLAFLLPDIFGNAVDQTYWRSRETWHFWETCGYVGILPLMLLFIKAEDRSTRRLRLFFLLLIALSLFLALGKYNPLYPIIYKLPGFNSFRIPAQIIFLYVLGIAVVSGIGMDRIFKGEWQTNRGFIPFFLLLGLILLFFVIGLILFPYDLFFHLFRYFADGPVTHANMADLYGRMSSSIYKGALIFFGASLLFFMLKRKRIYPSILIILFPAMVVADLYLFGSGFIQPYQFNNSSEKKRVVEELMRSPAKERIVTLSDMFKTNDGLRYGFPSILGYDPLIIRRYVHYVLSSQNWTPVDHVVKLGRVDKPGAKLLKLLHLKKVVYDSGIVVLDNEIPYAHIVNQAVIKPLDEVLPFMKSSEFDPMTMVVFEPRYQPLLFSPTGDGASEGSYKILEYNHENIRLSVSTSNPGYLILSEISYPGWKATVDGEETDILQGNFLFRVIPLQKGEHEVHMFYVSWPFRIGLIVSLLTLAASLWFIVWSRNRSLQKGS